MVLSFGKRFTVRARANNKGSQLSRVPLGQVTGGIGTREGRGRDVSTPGKAMGEKLPYISVFGGRRALRLYKGVRVPF